MTSGPIPCSTFWPLTLVRLAQRKSSLTTANMYCKTDIVNLTNVPVFLLFLGD
jgi:hypothetical protein